MGRKITMVKYRIMGKEGKRLIDGLMQCFEAVKSVVDTIISPVAGDMMIDYLAKKVDQLRRSTDDDCFKEVSNAGRRANKTKGVMKMYNCASEEMKAKIRLRLDSVILAAKVAQTVEGHRDPEGGDVVVEVLMEELMKLHSSYGKEPVSCDSCGGCDEDGDEIPRSAQDNEECGCADSGWACQDEEPCPCPGGDMCDCGRKYDLPFGCALDEAKNGARIARKGWNGKNQYVFLAKELEFHTDADLSEFEKHGAFVHDALAIKTSVDQIQIGWLASQSDMLSNDWYIVE